MKNRLAPLVVVVLVLVGVFWYFRSGSAPVATMSLIDLYPQAEKRSSIAVDQAFAVEDVTIDGDTKKVIFMHPTSRLTFRSFTVPRDAWLRTWVALKPDVWDRGEGDGVLFRFGISDGRTYDELVRQHVDPQNNRNDRRWIPIEVDLSSYSGLSVDLVFNTVTSLPGGGDNPANDWAVWGTPEIYLQ